MEDLDPGRTPEDYPSEDVVSPWDAAIEDMAASAAEYADAGREPVQLHPGDVTVSAGETPNANRGIDVLVPGGEFDRLSDPVADGRSTPTMCSGASTTASCSFRSS